MARVKYQSEGGGAYRVDCDGFYVRIDVDSANLASLYLYLADDTNLYGMSVRVDVSSTVYALGYDITSSLEVIENTPERIVLLNKGQLEDSSQNNLTNSGEVRCYWVIYPDRIVQLLEWDIDSGGSVILADSSANRINAIGMNSGIMTHLDTYYESSGSELAGDTSPHNSSECFSFLSDQINISLINLYHTDDGAYSQVSSSDSTVLFRWNNTTFSASTTHKMATVFLMDSSQRESTTPTTPWATSTLYHVGDLVTNGGFGYECMVQNTSGTFETDYGNGYWRPCHKYTSTQRLSMGSQYFDIPGSTVLVDIGDAKGSFVTDSNVPMTLDASEAMASDGAYHIDLSNSNHDAKLVFNQTERQPIVVIHENSLRTGSAGSPTEHIKSYWDCDSATLNIGTGSVTVSSATYTSGKRGNGVLIDASSETAYFQSSGNIVAAQGTIDFFVQETGTATANARFFQHSAAADRFQLYWTNATTMVLSINGTGITFTTDIDPLDGYLHHVRVCWDTTDDCAWLIIDGQVKDVDFTATTAPDLSSGNLYIGNGSAGTNPINGIIDEVKIYDTPIVPGSFVAGNVTGYAYVHSDITMYSDDGSTLRVGTGSVSNISNISNSAGSVSFQVDVGTPLSANETLFSAGTNFYIMWNHASQYIQFLYDTGYSIETTGSWLPTGLAGKHHIRATWKASDEITLEVDGLKFTATPGTAPTLGASISWSSIVGMTEKTITDQHDTPQFPTARGTLIHVPEITTV